MLSRTSGWLTEGISAGGYKQKLNTCGKSNSLPITWGLGTELDGGGLDG